jgi:hypothetical protein
MTFDNGRTIIALRLRLFLATVLLIVYIYLVFFGKELKFPLLGLESNAWTIIVMSLFIFIAFYPLAFNYKFIYYSDDGPNLVFRFHPVGIFGGKRNSIEIPKTDFAGYKVESYMLGFKMIKLSRKIDKRVAQYPALHLSALYKKEVDKLFSSLDSFSPKK